MSKIQTFILNINPKNGTVVIPMAVRKIIKSQTLFLSVIKGKLKLTVPKYTLQEVLNTPPKNHKKYKPVTKTEINNIMEDMAVKRYLKSN